MALQWINVAEDDFSGGIDVRSSENQLGKSFSEDLLNVETIEKRLRKRKGAQGKAGNIPVRVTAASQSGTELSLILPEPVNISTLRSSPLVVYGRTAAAHSPGEFTTTDGARYYSGFSTTVRKTFLATAGAPPYESVTVPGTEHNLGTANIYFGIVESTSTVTEANSTLLGVESISLDETSLDITISYQNSTGADKQAIPYYLSRDASAGSVYVTATVASSISIPAGTHGLSNFNIVSQVWGDTTAGAGGVRRVVIPDSFTINSAGQVDIVFSQAPGAVAGPEGPYNNYTIILTAPDAANTVSTSVPSGNTGSLVLNSPAGPFIFSSLYQVNGTALERVQPDTVVFDPGSDTTTWSLTNGTGTTQTYEVFYEYGDVRSNRLTVTGTTSATWSEAAPQLTVWGLDHTEIYSASDARQGWATHLDSYRRSGESHLLTGLGGNLFSDVDYSTAGTAYLYGSSSPDLIHVVDGTRILGPLFWDAGETPGRTRGYITATLAGTHWGQVTSVSWNSGTGYTDYTISLPGKSILDSSGTPTSLSSVISTAASLQDWLTIEGMGYDRHNGAFRIRAVADGTDEIVISVENGGVDSADWDDSDTGGLSGIFTDQVNLTTTVRYIPGDILQSSVFGDAILSVLSVSSDNVVIDGITKSISLGSGLSLPASRTTSVVPLSSPTGFVRGDMVSYTGIDRLLRVLRVRSGSNEAVTISGDGTTATVSGASTDSLVEGQEVLLTDAGVYTGVVTIESLTTATAFTFSSTETTSTGGTLSGSTIELDESISWEDTTNNVTAFRVEERWIPIEAPTSTGNLLPTTHIYYLDSGTYDNQDFLRSTMVSDNSYLTNSVDEVLKYDGADIYRAGLLPWQTQVFLTQDTAATAKIITGARSLAYSAVTAAEGRLTITAATSESVPVGTHVRLSGSTQTYIIRSYYNDGTNYYVLMDRALDAGVVAGTAGEIIRFTYYYRLNAVDANNNIVASAVTGSEDTRVELTADAAIYHRLVGLPAWDNYDHDRIDVQIYRTKAGLSAPFYLVGSKTVPFDSNDGYIDFTDTADDDTLTDLDQTSVLSEGLGTGWQEPLRAKYVTSAGNSLVLGNIRDYPQLDLQIDSTRTLTDADFAGDTLLFRRTAATTATTTDMLTAAVYEWRNVSSAVLLTSVVGAAGASFTVTTAAPHGMTTGDWAYLFWVSVATASQPLTYSGWWQVTVTGLSTFTVNHTGATAGALAGVANFRLLTAADPTNIPVPMGTDGNWGTLNGNSSFITFSAARRMSLAINSTMRKVDTSISGYTTFTPWLVARGGGEFKSGQLIVRQPRSDSEGPRVVPTFSGYDLFINNIRTTSGTTTVSSTRTYPSRLIFSFENYPEIFDSPTAVLDTDSQSAIDVNPADGQEITGVIPFFGDAAFGAAQQSAVVVVFKSNSIYLIDLNEKRNGRNPVQRIETEGLGCTAPFSIAVTKNGIIFANESGIYALGRNLAIRYIGKWMERNWLESVNRDELSILQGHHYAVGRQYKLSVPIGSANTNSEVYVYDHTAESVQRDGAWTRFDSHPATGWANLEKDAYYCTSTGRVMSIRRLGDLTDYRDDNSAITSSITTRAFDFGNAGIRKALDGFAAHYRVLSTSENTTAFSALDMREDFWALDAFQITKPVSTDGLSELSVRKMQTIWHSVGRLRGVYFQVKIENTGLDESLELAGLDFRVAGMSDRGILMAAETAAFSGT